MTATEVLHRSPVRSGVLLALLLTLLVGQVWGLEHRPRPAPVSLIQEQVRLWSLEGPDRRFKDIGWMPSFEAALAAAKAQQRPVFLLTALGRLDRGRC